MDWLKLLIAPALVLLAVPALASAEGPPSGGDLPLPDGPFGLTGSLEERYLALKDAEVPMSSWYPVQEVTVAIGMMRLQLLSGAATPVTTSTGITAGFVYRGECRFTYRPPTGAEAESFQRGTGLAEWRDEPCDSVFLHTDDEALLDRLGLVGEEVASPPPLSEEHRILLDDFVSHSSLPMSALARHLGATRSRTPTYDLIVFGGEYGAPPVVDKEEALKPYNAVAVAHLPEGVLTEDEGFVLMGVRRFGTGKHDRLLTSHPLDGGPAVAPPPPSVRVRATDLRLDLDIVPTDSFVRMNATATLTLGPSGRAARAVLLSLSGGEPDKPTPPGERNPLRVSDVRDAQGRSLRFLHRRGRLLIQLATSLSDGESGDISISYAGSGVKKEGQSHFGLFANWDWFPKGPSRSHMDWRATICLPDGPSIAGTGRTLSSEVVDGRRCEVHEAAAPVNFPALNMGWWVGQSLKSRGMTLRAWFSREQTAQVEPALKLTEHILGTYADYFGPLPHKELDVAQGRNFRFFWQAPDGLVEMSASIDAANLFAKKIFPADFIPDFDAYILAHELAHQYWGHVVGWGSYRDQWISESFADYSAYMYMLRANGEASGHHQYWRRSGVVAGRFGVSTLGQRNGRLYQPLVYSRGPLIIHMFRRMVGDEAFLAWLRAVVDVGRKKQEMTTEDLIVIAEHVTGPDARWFWEQWLDHPVVPDLQASWSTSGQTTTVTLTQSKTPEPLRLIVPVLIQSKRGEQFDVLYNVALATEQIVVELTTPKGGAKGLKLDPYEEVVRDKAKVTRVTE